MLHRKKMIGNHLYNFYNKASLADDVFKKARDYILHILVPRYENLEEKTAFHVEVLSAQGFIVDKAEPLTKKHLAEFAKYEHEQNQKNKDGTPVISKLVTKNFEYKNILCTFYYFDSEELTEEEMHETVAHFEQRNFMPNVHVDIMHNRLAGTFDIINMRPLTEEEQAALAYKEQASSEQKHECANRFMQSPLAPFIFGAMLASMKEDTKSF